MDKPFKHTWTQSYGGEGKYQRLYHCAQILESHRQLIIWDRLDPITDVTQAADLLRKFCRTPPD